MLAFITEHLSASAATRLTLTIWAAQTHALGVFGTTAYLHISSPEPECGKTRVLELLELLCREPLRASSISTAATFRAIHELTPTLLLDEVDNLLRDRMARGELLGILNDGYRRGGSVFRMGGAKMSTLERFNVFCPKAFAGLEELPTDALKSRCLRLEITRRKHDEPGADFVFEDEQERGHELRDRLAVWAESVRGELQGKRPTRLEGIRDRTWETVRPLVILADAAGEDWSEGLRHALLELATPGDKQTRSAGVRLLADCRRVFDDMQREWFTKAELLGALKTLEDAPYAEWEDFTTNKLSRRLGKYGIPGDAWVHDCAGKTHRGWSREHFEEPWARFIPSTPQAKRANRADGLTKPLPATEKPCGGPVPHALGESLYPHGYANRTVCTLSQLLPGDDGFRAVVTGAHAAGYLTSAERRERRLVHDLILRAAPAAGEKAILAEVQALVHAGFFTETSLS